MWQKMGITTHRIAVAYQNPESMINLLGIIKLRREWIIRVRASSEKNNSVIQDAFQTAGLQSSSVKYHEHDGMFVFKTDAIDPIVKLIHAISPLMQDFFEIESGVMRLLGVNLAQDYPNPHWIRASHHAGSTHLKYFNQHKDATVNTMGINEVGGGLSS